MSALPPPRGLGASQLVHISGAFDVPAALVLAGRLEARPAPHVALDLSWVSEWHPFALVALILRLRAAGRSLTIASWPPGLARPLRTPGEGGSAPGLPSRPDRSAR